MCTLWNGGHALFRPDLGHYRRRVGALLAGGQDGGAGQRGPAHGREVVLLSGLSFSHVMKFLHEELESLYVDGMIFAQ